MAGYDGVKLTTNCAETAEMIIGHWLVGLTVCLTLTSRPPMHCVVKSADVDDDGNVLMRVMEMRADLDGTRHVDRVAVKWDDIESIEIY